MTVIFVLFASNPSILALPFFYTEKLSQTGGRLALDGAASRHISQVLRMKKGDSIILTDGKGKRCRAVLREQTKKECVVDIDREVLDIPPLKPRLTIAISLLKNASRFEWFLEKAAETGINAIVPLICERTERVHFRMERMQHILVSAMLQSQQCWLPEIAMPTPFNEWVVQTGVPHRYIAHCIQGEKMKLSRAAGSPGETAICIGPEGDFSVTETEWALQHSFVPVSLGDTRLRTETAGVAAAVLLRIG